MSWSSKNANSCNAYGGWSGNKAPTGSESISNLTKSTYYALICSNDADFDSDSVNVFISAIAPVSPFIADDDSLISPDSEAASTDSSLVFGGMVTNVSPCTIPLQNNSIQLFSSEEGRLVRFIWKMGESQLEEVLGLMDYVPSGIPEVGMWLLGELSGEEGECYGAGGPGKIIKFAGYGFK